MAKQNDHEPKQHHVPAGDYILRGTLLLALSFFFLFQNCAPFTAKLGKYASTNFSSVASGGDRLFPETDKTDANCMSSTAYDACIFLKNPVAVQNASYSGPVMSAKLSAQQTFGVKLTGLSGAGKLANTTFHVDSVTGQPVVLGATNLHVAAESDPARTLAQVMTYYWMNRAIEYVEPRTKIFQAKGKNIRVVADDTLTGWSPDTNSIHLKINDAGQAMAWDGEMAIYFLGVANLHYATSGAIRTGLSTHHKTCGLKDNGCCKDSLGCARAIESGVGDYFASILFPDKPTLGETWANSPQGLGFCNLSRDLNEAKTRDSKAAYDACSAVGVPGEVSTMGTLYASLWWEVRKAAAARAESSGKDGAKDIDTLFMTHLQDLNGDDTFLTALVKILAVDQKLNAGAYSDLLRAQFNARVK